MIRDLLTKQMANTKQQALAIPLLTPDGSVHLEAWLRWQTNVGTRRQLELEVLHLWNVLTRLNWLEEAVLRRDEEVKSMGTAEQGRQVRRPSLRDPNVLCKGTWYWTYALTHRK